MLAFLSIHGWGAIKKPCLSGVQHPYLGFVNVLLTFLFIHGWGAVLNP